MHILCRNSSKNKVNDTIELPYYYSFTVGPLVKTIKKENKRVIPGTLWQDTYKILKSIPHTRSMQSG